MKTNFMDTFTRKEKEEQMGLTEGQKASLKATGLTSEEIKSLHEARLMKSIQEEREELDKLERKLSKGNLSSVLVSLLADEDDDETRKAEVLEDDTIEPIFTNAEANIIIGNEARKIKGFEEADAEFMDAALDIDAEDYDKKGGRLAKIAGKIVDMISPIVDKVMLRRWKGYQLAYAEWVKNEKDGMKPDPWSGMYTVPILDYYNYIQ